MLRKCGQESRPEGDSHSARGLTVATGSCFASLGPAVRGYSQGKGQRQPDVFRLVLTIFGEGFRRTPRAIRQATGGGPPVAPE